MYHCLTCNGIHHQDESAEKIFKSGYILVNETKVPLGICKPRVQQEKKRGVIFKGPFSILQSFY